MSTNIIQELERIVEIALNEDEAFRDVTSDSVLTSNNLVNFAINSRDDLVFCGEKIITEVFAQLQKSEKFKLAKLDLEILAKDAQVLKAGNAIAKGCGDAKLVFAAERVILNLVQHLSAVATSTRTIRVGIK